MKYKIIGTLVVALAVLFGSFVVTGLLDNSARITSAITQTNSVKCTVNNLIDEYNKMMDGEYDKLPPNYDFLRSVTCKVVTDSGSGTGVLVTRKVGPVFKTFVWTAGHVVQGNLKGDKFSNVKIYQEFREYDRFVSSTTVEAKVIAYSDPSVDDLALLEIIQDNYSYANTTFRSWSDGPEYGEPVLHVGCTLGLYDSLSLGVVSQTDVDLLNNKKMFDQTSCIGYPGSSGGGVYTYDGKCVGLLVRGGGAGINFIVPARRLRDWAEIMGIEWAVDIKADMPMAGNVRAESKLFDDSSAPAPLNVSGPQSIGTSIDQIIEKIIEKIKRATGQTNKSATIPLS